MCLEDRDCSPQGRERREFLFTAIAGSVFLTTRGVALGADQPPTRVLDDPRVSHGRVSFKRGDEEVGGYLARPKRAGRHRAVLVIAGNRITEEYIPNTCAALALAGYVGLAPDIFHSVPDERDRERLISTFDLDNTVPEWALAYSFDVVLRGRASTPMEE